MSALLPVFGISRLRMETDGDGVTTLVGCLGCPLRCRLCINPHAQNPATPHRRLSAEQLVDELRVDGLYFSATGGGATFGGGEPLLHADCLAEFAEKRPADWRDLYPGTPSRELTKADKEAAMKIVLRRWARVQRYLDRHVSPAAKDYYHY